LPLGRCGPGSGNLRKKAQTYPYLLCHQKNTQIQNFPNFFIRKYKSYQILRGFEQLSGSIAWRFMVNSVSAILRQNFGARGTYNILQEKKQKFPLEPFFRL